MDRRIKKKIIKTGVELLVKNKSTGKYEHQGYFPSKMEAEVFARKNCNGSEFRTPGVRMDATPYPAVGNKRSEGSDNG